MTETDFAILISRLNLDQNTIKLKKKIKSNMLELITVTNQIKVENFFSSDLSDLLKTDYISIINSIKTPSNRIHNVYGGSKSGIILEWIMVILQNPEDYAKIIVNYFHQNNRNLGYFAAVTFPAIFHQFYTAIFHKLSYRFLKSILKSEDIGTFWYFCLSFLESATNFSKLLWESFQNFDYNQDFILSNYSMSKSKGLRNLYSYEGKFRVEHQSQWNIQASQIFMYFIKCLKNASTNLSIYQQKILKKLFQANAQTCALFICKYLILRPFFLLRGDENGTRLPSSCSLPSMSSLSSTIKSDSDKSNLTNSPKTAFSHSKTSTTVFRRMINEEIIKIIEFASVNANSPQFMSILNAITNSTYSRFVPNIAGTHTNFVITPCDCYMMQEIIKHSENTNSIRFVKVYPIPDDDATDFRPMSVEIPLSNIFGDSKIHMEKTDSTIYNLELFSQKDVQLEQLLDLAFFDKFIDNELSRQNLQQKQTLACFSAKLLQRCSLIKNDTSGLNDLYGYLDKNKKQHPTRVNIHRSSTLSGKLNLITPNESTSLFTSPAPQTANIALSKTSMNVKLEKNAQMTKSTILFPRLSSSRSTEFINLLDNDPKQAVATVRRQSQYKINNQPKVLKPSFFDPDVLVLSDENSVDVDLIHMSNGRYFRYSSIINDDKQNSTDSLYQNERKVSFEEIDDKKEIKMIEKEIKKEKKMRRQTLKQQVKKEKKERKEERKVQKKEMKKKKQDDNLGEPKKSKKEKKNKKVPLLNLNVTKEPETMNQIMVNDIDLSSSEYDVPFPTLNLSSCSSARARQVDFKQSTEIKKKKKRRTKSDTFLISDANIRQSFLSILSEKIMVVPILEDIMHNIQYNETKLVLYCIKLNDFEYKSNDLDSIAHDFAKSMNAQRILKFGKYKMKYSMWWSAASLVANMIDFMNEIKVGSAIFVFCQLCSFFFPISSKHNSTVLRSSSIELLTSKSIFDSSVKKEKVKRDSLFEFEISDNDNNEYDYYDSNEYEEESNQSALSVKDMPIPVYTQPLNKNVVKFVRLALMLSNTDCFVKYFTWIFKILVAFPELRKLLGSLYGIELSYLELAFKIFLSKIDMNLLKKVIHMIKENVDKPY